MRNNQLVQPLAFRLSGLAVFLAITIGIVFALAVDSPAAPTPDQQKKLQQAETFQKNANTQFIAGNLKRAGDLFDKALPLATELADVPEFEKQLADLNEKLQKLHTDLEAKGIKVQSMPTPAAPPTPPDPKAKVKGKAAVMAPLPDKDLSFTKNIAPLLLAKCGRCHVNDSKGKFSMASYDSLKKGTPDGVVFRPGKGAGSRMIDVLESGDMPKGGQKLTKPEIAGISKWIDEGAKFDGPDEKTPLAKLVPGGAALATKAADEPKLKVVEATGKETVQFSKDIAPVLVANCFSCHAGQQPTGNFQMASFNQMVRGGQSGNPWVPYKSADSLIIKKLKGTAGARMPQPKNAKPLPDDVIAKFEKWVDEGARFDGPDAGQSTQMLAAVVRSKSATSEELSADRKESAKRLWNLADPTDKATIKETKNLLVVSSLPDATLSDITETAEQQAAAVAKQLHAPADQPLVKGRIVLLVLPSRYYYSEFSKMVQQRQAPADERGHWKYDVVDAYGYIVPPSEPTEYSVASVIAQQLASVYVASLPGNPPAWFCEGSGRAVAARADAKGNRVRAWNDRLHQLAADGRLATFITRGLSPEDNDIAAYAFVKDLMASAGKYSQLILAMRGGQSFDEAFPKTFGNSPAALAAAWAKSVK